MEITSAKGMEKNNAFIIVECQLILIFITKINKRHIPPIYQSTHPIFVRLFTTFLAFLTNPVYIYTYYFWNENRFPVIGEFFMEMEN